MGSQAGLEAARNKAGAIEVRLASRDDLFRILEISNWAIEHTTANFRTEQETLVDWVARWEETHEQYPWLVGTCGAEITGFAMASPYKGR